MYDTFCCSYHTLLALLEECVFWKSTVVENFSRSSACYGLGSKKKGKGVEGHVWELKGLSGPLESDAC